ncbi:uncharacterized protein LOC142331715 [Lycorma delicatula]|uniref:uncharacterized protein LOC142331715 n=1 Tax=Lycorma delicatula TaxID=130591 RepID=UPI003F51024B
MDRITNRSRLTTTYSMPYTQLFLILLLLCLIHNSTGQKPNNNNSNNNNNNNERTAESNREPFLVKVTSSGNKTPEKRGTVRLTTVPGQNTFPYRFVYPVGQPSYTQYAAYTTPRSITGFSPSSSPSSASSSGYHSTPTQPLKLAYTLPTTMLLVMAPHASHSPSGNGYGNTFMLIPAAATPGAHQPAYNYNILPQARVPTVAYIPAHYIPKPNVNFANLVAAHQLVYKQPLSNNYFNNNNNNNNHNHHNHAPNHNYNPNVSSEEENDSSESGSTTNYGNRVRSAERFFKG